MTPDLRLIRYFVAVAEEGNVTRAAERLHISQPSLSTAMQQLESQLGVELVVRVGRRIEITPAGELLRERGRELLDQADAVVDEVRHRHDAGASRLSIGVSPTARYGIAQRLLVACTTEVPAVMLYTVENTTGALLRDTARGRIDLAITFCAPDPPPGVELFLLHDEPAVVHLPSGHPLAPRAQLTLEDLREETVLVAATDDSHGFSNRVLAAFAAAGMTPHTLADPYPDLGLQAVREGLGIVIYLRSAFPAQLPGSAFIPLNPPVRMPFHLAYRVPPKTTAVRSVLEVVRTLQEEPQDP
ncbi:MAG: LysR family transcriptional regulator [Solirubrobacteraceae bacterium]